MRRVLLFGAAWITFLVLTVAVVVRSAGPATSTSVVTTPAPPPPPPRAGAHYPGWTVTRAYSAHRMMVVEVEADQPAAARNIALEVVEPLENRYDEVLVYVRRRAAAKNAFAARRVQWTPRGGFVEAVYER